MSEKKDVRSFLSDIDMSDVKKSAKMNIKPKLTFDALGVEYAKEIEIMSDYYEVEIPKKKAKGLNKLIFLDVLYMGIDHQFIAQAKSFRYQLAVCQIKLGMNPETDSPEGMVIKLWKVMAETKEFGKAEVYLVENVE